MGVNGLWKLLTPVSRPIALETLNNKRLAIDASIWIYQFQMTMRDKKSGDSLVGAHIMGTFRRVVKLLYHGMKPVFVFDGEAPALKKRTVAERKRRKVGAQKDLAKTAQQLLSAQLRAAATEHQLKKKRAQQAREAAYHGGDEVEIDTETAVYLDDLDAPLSSPPPNQPPKDKSKPSPKKYIPKDQYALPSLDGSVQSRAKASDPRIATEAELREYIDAMRPEDFDIDSDFFSNLPIEVKYEIVGDLRIKSRQVNHRRVEQMRQAATPLDFSKQQIKNVMERNTLTQKLFEVTDTLGQAAISIPTRVAGQKNREYMLIKQDESKGGGWVLGVKDPIVANNEPLVISSDEEDHDGTDSDDFEEVEQAHQRVRTPSPEAETRRALAIEAIRARYAPAAPAPDFDPYLDREPRRPSTSVADLFLSDDHAGGQRFEAVGDEEDDAELQQALFQSMMGSRGGADGSDGGDEDPFERLANLANFGGGAASAGMERVQSTSTGTEGEQAGYDSDESLEYLDDEPKVRQPPPPQPVPQSLPHHMIKNQPAVVVIESDDSDEGDFEEVDISTTSAPLAPTSHASSRPLPNDKPAATPVGNPSRSRTPLDPSVVAPPVPFIVPSTAPSYRSPSKTPAPSSAPAMSRADSSFSQQPTARLSAMDTFLPSDSDDSDAGEKVRPALRGPGPRDVSPRPTAPPLRPHPTIPAAESPQKYAQTATSTNGVTPVPSVTTTSAPARAQSPPRPPSPMDVQDLPVATSSKVTLDDVRATSGRANLSPAPEMEAGVTAELEKADTEAGDEDEEFLEGWERSPTPPARPSTLFRSESAPDFEEEPDPSDSDHDADYERELEGYADMVSRLNNRDLTDMRDSAQNEIATLKAQRNAETRNADGATRQMVADIKVLLQLFGIPYVDAPQEAEAECAELLQRNLVDGIVTDDSDVFLFGGSRVYRHMFNDKKYVECYLLADLERELGLDRDKLIKLAYLLGGDYADGLPGVGPVLGRELLEEFRDLTEFKYWWGKVQSGKDEEGDTDTPWKRKFKKGHRDLFLDERWPNSAIGRAYTHPIVNTEDEPFSWAGPDLDGLRSYLKEMLSWGGTKVDEIMLPLIRRLNDRKAGKINYQVTLGDYFDVSAGSGPLRPGQRKGYSSGRLQNVLKAHRDKQRLQNKTDGDKEEDDEDEDDLPPPPPKPKAKRKKAAPKAPPTPEGDEEGDDDRADDVAPAEPAKKKRAPAKRAATAPKPKRLAKSTAASRKKKELAARDARAEARGGFYSSEEEFEAPAPQPRRAASGDEEAPPPRPRAKRLSAQKRPIVDDGSDSDDAAVQKAKRRKRVLGIGEEEEDEDEE